MMLRFFPAGWRCVRGLIGLVVALAALFPRYALALSSTRPLSEFGVDIYTTREGLPHNQVNTIAQTPEGYMWFGTWEGLVRYDGTQFRVFDRVSLGRSSSRELGMRDNGIRSVWVARDGSLLVGTSRGGVMHLKDNTWSFIDPRGGLPSSEIMGVEDDAQGNLWFATEAAGVAVMDKQGGIRRFTSSQGLPSDIVIDIAIDQDGGVWVGTARGLAVIRRDKISTFGPAEGMPVGPVGALLVGRHGVVYAGSERGVYRYDGTRFVTLNGEVAALKETITALFEDRVGAVWAGSGASGLYRFGEHGEEHFGVEYGLPNSRVASIFEDREGSVWVGTNAGLMRLKEGPFSMLDRRHGLADNFVRAVLQDKDGTWWFATSRGLSSYKNGHFETMTTAQGLASDSVMSLLQDKDGTMWAGTFGRGVTAFTPNTVRSYSVGEGLPGNQVRALAQSPDGAIWIGTTRGLARKTAAGFQSFTSRDGLPRDYIMSLHVDRAGVLWIGTSNGLARWRNERIEPVALPLDFDVEDVFDVADDGQGDVWFATDRGLLRYRDDRFTQFGTADGLPVESLFHVTADGYGYLWLTSNRGVLRVSRNAVGAVLDKKQSRAEVDVFREADGLGSSQCNGGAGPSAWLGSDNVLRVATAAGVASVELDRFNRNPGAPPPVVIEGLRFDDESVEAVGTPKLKAGVQRLEFRFSGLTFLNPDRVRFRYRLIGFDRGWTQLQGERSAHYTNVPPGNYTFEVAAANADGPWSSEPASLSFEMAPHWYQRTGVQMASFGLILLMAYLGYRARVAVLHARHQHLERVVDERTRDLNDRNQKLTALDAEKSQLLERLREQKEAFERQAREDALTGLANRRFFDSEAARLFAGCRATGEPIAMALVDIDHFKRINDQFSHAAGDDALRVIGSVLAEQCKSPMLAARYGGEEFVIAMPGVDLAGAVNVCEAIRKRIAEFDWSTIVPGMQVSGSFGVSARVDAANHERLLADADRYMYAAKSGGRNRVASELTHAVVA